MKGTQPVGAMRSRSSRFVGLALLSLAATSHSFQPPSRPHAIRYNTQSSSPAVGAPGRNESPSLTSLNAVSPAAALAAVGSPLGSVGVLAFVILVHEAGHFLAARSLGMQVDEFSVGVGPRLVGLRRRQVDGEFVFEKIDDAALKDESDGSEDKTDDSIEFSLRAVPLGGYVRFPENYNRTLAFEQEDAARKARDAARLMRVENGSPLEKALESMAANSFTLNLLSLGLLKKWQAMREEEQLRQAEEELAGRSDGSSSNGAWWSSMPWASEKDETDTESSKLAILKAAKTPEIDYFDDPDLLQNRPWQERAIVLSGGVAFNILLAFACYFGQLQTKGLPQPVFDNGAVISQIPNTDSPSFGLLKRGDVIVGVNNAFTSAAKSSADIWASQKEISSVISTIRETPEGESVKLTILHGKDADKTEVITVTPKRNQDGQASIGVMLGPNYLRTDVVKASNIFDGISKAGSAVYQVTSETARSIFGLLLSFVFGKGLPAGASLSGPIGVVKSGAEVVKSSDFAAVVAFAASISINLAVVNSLPLPALDGGQLAFVLAEAAAGRRIDQRLQEGINAGALLILLVISFGTAVGDVTSMFK